jgi:mRNA interferase RelE/StbE
MYSIEYHEDVKRDFKELGHTITVLALKKIQKIAQNPILGKELGNKANLNLVGLRKVYINNKKVRIVYKIIEDKITIFVVTVGKREDMEVYKKAATRLRD